MNTKKQHNRKHDSFSFESEYGSELLRSFDSLDDDKNRLYRMITDMGSDHAVTSLNEMILASASINPSLGDKRLKQIKNWYERGNIVIAVKAGKTIGFSKAKGCITIKSKDQRRFTSSKNAPKKENSLNEAKNAPKKENSLNEAKNAPKKDTSSYEDSNVTKLTKKELDESNTPLERAFKAYLELSDKDKINLSNQIFEYELKNKKQA